MMNDKATDSSTKEGAYNSLTQASCTGAEPLIIHNQLTQNGHRTGPSRTHAQICQWKEKQIPAPGFFMYMLSIRLMGNFQFRKKKENILQSYLV